MIRSFLFVPGDSPAKMVKAEASGAHALILDLEDAVLPARKAEARGAVAEYLAANPRPARTTKLWVRINPLDSGMLLEDLTAVISQGPDGVVLPKANGAADVRVVSHYLDALEAQAGVAGGSVQILPVATETPLAPFRLGEYATAGLERLYGLTWGAEDLSAALGASGNRDETGAWAETYRMVRSLTLLAAHAAKVAAIETLYADFRDVDGLRRSCRLARAEGFRGRIAIHPAQIQAINESFLPSEEEVAHARAVIAAFDAAPGAGAVSLDGKMLDIPHLKQARALLSELDR